ncbi:MAG TPA: hypothetical protein VGU25_05345 [Acidobacteriaceae bacterium]|nr:hypothetical protein [Acidobacteriaceae bacterium]
MRPMRFGQAVQTTVLCSAVFLLLSDAGVRGGGGVMAAQRSPAMNSGRPIDPPSSGVPPVYPIQMGNSTDGGAQAANAERRKKVAADVDRLVLLSNELKADVDKTANDQLSLDVIKKAKEIEKLAHAVQGQMKN